MKSFKNLTNTIKIFCLILGSVASALEQNAKYIELSGTVNGRSDAHFRRDVDDKNISQILAPGTQGEILNKKLFKNTGNYGLYIKVTSGPYAGQPFWIYYNEKDVNKRAVKLFDKPPTVSDRKPLNKLSAARYTYHTKTQRAFSASIKLEKEDASVFNNQHLEDSLDQWGYDSLNNLCAQSNSDSKKNSTSISCIKWAAQQAEKAFSDESRCNPIVNSKLMMCIFEQETSFLPKNIYSCSTNGCGLGQMTGSGVATVNRGLFSHGLYDDFEQFMKSVGRGGQAYNQAHHLSRQSARDPMTSIAMTATHLCAQAKVNGTTDPCVLARDYNGSYNKYKYQQNVCRCYRKKTKTNVSQRNLISNLQLKAECRGFNTCGSNSLAKNNQTLNTQPKQTTSEMNNGQN